MHGLFRASGIVMTHRRHHAPTLRGVRSEWLGHFWRVWGGKFWRAPKESALPDGNWLDALHLARESPYEPEVIVTDPLADARFWAEALNLAHTICWRSPSTSQRCAAF